MANSNSSTSLYTFQSNVKVSPNNFTTLYNSKPGSVATGNVGDRNFTTLYTKQSDITPTRPYGNSNVEAFLNVGHDSGGNVVQNINMSGNLTVAKQTYLGNVSNVHIEGGNSGYVLTTNGLGNLIWEAPSGSGGNAIPYIHFDVTSDGNNQQFTDIQLSSYANSNVMNVMKNGVNIEPFYYEKISPSVLQVNIELHAGDTIDVLAEGASGGSSLPGGGPNTVQYNDGYALAGSNSFTFTDSTTTLEVAPNGTGTINTSFIHVSDTLNVSNLVTTSANLGDVSNVKISGGTNGYVLQTDGLGNLSWTAQTGGGGNGVPGGSNTQVQLNIDGAFAGDPNLTFSSQTLSSPYFSGDGSLLSNINGANVSNVANSNHANVADVANLVYGSNVSGDVSGSNHANVADVAGVANSVSGSNVSGQVGNALIAGTVYTNAQPNITSLGTLTNLTSGGTVDFTTSSNISLGTISNLHIDGGSASQVLTTNGAGVLSWATVTAGAGGANTQIQYNDNGILAGTSALTFNNTTGNLSGSFGNITVSTGFTSTGDVIIQRAYEKFTTNVSAATGTVNFDVLNQSILYFSANAAANFTLNIRGDSITSLNSILPVNETVTIVFLNTVGTTAYIANQIQIDGSNVTPIYVNGLTPSTGTRLTSAKQSYTYTIMKTGSSAYTVLGSLTEFK